MTAAPQIRPAIRFRGRSFLALVLAPVAPLDAWFDELDLLASRSPGFFTGRPVVLDVAALPLGRARAWPRSSPACRDRSIRVMAIESARRGGLDPSLPPPIAGGRDARPIEPDQKGRAAPAASTAQRSGSLTLETPGPLRPDHRQPDRRRHRARLGRRRGPRSSPAARSTSTARCAAAPSPARPARPARASSAASSRPSFWRSTDSTRRRTAWTPALRGKATQAWLDGDAMRIAALD